MEVTNMDPAVKEHLKNMMASSSPPVLPQLALEVMVNPPSPGDPSYEIYKKVKKISSNFLLNKASYKRFQKF